MNTDSWSESQANVFAAARTALESGQPAVLATVVDVEGNAYRRPGAKMIVSADGDGVGNVTAGCLEDEILTLARDVIERDEPRVETYDLTGDDDVWGLGVGCNGIVDVLLEPLSESLRPILRADEQRTGIGVVTVVETTVDGLATGDRAYVGAVDPTTYTADSNETLVEQLPEHVHEELPALIDRGAGAAVGFETDTGTTTVFVDGIAPPPELVVLGTGNDVGPVVDLATRNEFRVTVVGFRGGTDPEERFPAAAAGETTSPRSLPDVHDFDDHTYVVAMTHNFVDDRLAVEALLSTDVPYVGLLGPQERFEEMLEEFEAEGRTLSEPELRRVFTPVGLDLGGGTPYQIAHSIVSEVLSVHNGTEPGHLRDRSGPIHERVDLSKRG
ncbi:XdhC family protein [Salinigranum sp. GCM10025319]|uniref:XdhC family protein n=1 Tax=Salinigranum sp. GCM10025319 TaxID=3252687 RepID=UPI003621CC0C